MLPSTLHPRVARLQIQRAFVVAFIALGPILAWAPQAHAFGCQASGSLPIFPSNGTTCPLALGLLDTVDITITLNHTSSSVPPGTSVSGILVNACVAGLNNGANCAVDSECPGGLCGPAVTYTLACVDTACSLELPGVLTFVPVNANGCVSNAPAVTGCVEDPGNSNRVKIFVTTAGIPLGAASSTTIATIRAQATAAVPFSLLNPCGVFGTRADTPFNSIVTTDDRCEADATGGAQGSSNLFLPQATETPTPTATPTATKTVTPTPTKGSTKTPTPTQTKGATKTPTPTATKGATKTPTPTATKGKTATPTHTKGATKTPTPTATKGKTPTPTHTKGATKTPTPTATKGKTATPTHTKGATKTPTPSVTPHKDKDVCRPSSYWKVYAGTSKHKSCSQNITQAVLDARGSLAICGEVVKTTSLDDAASAVEALCTSASDGTKRQLARELTAAALNCIVSDLASGRDPKANPLCGGGSNAALFANCNALCAGTGGSGTISQCTDALKCVSSGDIWTGSYCKDNPYPECDDAKLPRCDVLALPNCKLSSYDACYGQQGEAGGSGKCTDAGGNQCEILGDGEPKCACDSDPAANENPHCS